MSVLCSRCVHCQSAEPSEGSHHGLLAEVVARGLFRGVRFFFAEIKQRRLLCGMFAQFSHLVDVAGSSLLLFPLIPALCLVPLSLLPGVFLLALCEC